MVSFLRDVLRHFGGRVIVVWDGWTVHGAALRRVASSRLEAVTLPPYTPELNPVEQLWGRVKWSDLANAAFTDSTALLAGLRPLRVGAANCAAKLRSFWQGAKLKLPQPKLRR